MGRSQREEEEKILKAITLFCFPEGIDWAPMTEYQRWGPDSYNNRFLRLSVLWLLWLLAFCTLSLCASC